MRRGTEFSMMLGPNELMNSRLSGSEEALATLACKRLEAGKAPHLLIGGLGMGFTLRAALAVLGSEARITVAELVPAVIAWARGPMAGIFGDSLSDPRVHIREADVADVQASPRIPLAGNTRPEANIANDLGEVDDLQRQLQAVDHALHVEQTGHVGRGDVFRAVAVEVVDAVVAHLGRDRLVGDAKAAAEPAALVGPVDLDQLESSDLPQQVSRLREVGLVDPLRRPRMAEAPDGGAAVVEAHPVRKGRPGEGRDLQVVVQELDELSGPGADLPGLGRLFDRIEVIPDVVDAAPGWPDDRVEILEAVDEEGFGGGGIVLATAVGHRLAAAGLVERILDRAAEPLEEL